MRFWDRPGRVHPWPQSVSDVESEEEEMKRFGTVLVVWALLLALSAGAARSATFYGTSGPGETYGTSRDDFIGGAGGGDLLSGASGCNDVSGGEHLQAVGAYLLSICYYDLRFSLSRVEGESVAFG